MRAGEWKVTFKGWARVLNILQDRKVVSDEAGHNVARGHEWGWFKIVEDNKRTLLSYDDRRNPWRLRKLRDRITEDGEDAYAGKAYWFGVRVCRFRLSYDVTTYFVLRDSTYERGL